MQEIEEGDLPAAHVTDRMPFLHMMDLHPAGLDKSSIRRRQIRWQGERENKPV